MLIMLQMLQVAHYASATSSATKTQLQLPSQLPVHSPNYPPSYQYTAPAVGLSVQYRPADRPGPDSHLRTAVGLSVQYRPADRPGPDSHLRTAVVWLPVRVLWSAGRGRSRERGRGGQLSAPLSAIIRRHARLCRRYGFSLSPPHFESTPI